MENKNMMYAAIAVMVVVVVAYGGYNYMQSSSGDQEWKYPSKISQS